MGKRGPKPKPTALRVFEGNPSRRELNAEEPHCEMPASKPHAVGMDALASAEFDRVMAAMPPGVYTALDVATLGQYALAWSMLVKAQQSIDEDGILIETFSVTKDGEQVFTGKKINPATKIWKAAAATLIQTSDRLGLSPGVRSRLKVPSRKEAEGGKFAGLIKA